MPLSLSLPEVLVIVAGTCAIAIAVRHALTQYLLPPSRASGAQVAFAELYRVPRRHLESIRTWEARTLAAAKALHAASDAFVAEAETLGRVERFSHAGLKWTLPSTHPLAIAYVVARYPDGPPPVEIARIAMGEYSQLGRLGAAAGRHDRRRGRVGVPAGDASYNDPMVRAVAARVHTHHYELARSQR